MYNKDITKDIERIKQISIVPTMLEVICKTTKMGFAAIARVTEDSWVACSVRDEISFGLQPGGELVLETTICNEIRVSREAVVIDHVEKSKTYGNHHTPKLYGFQSYISVPITFKNGELFGTLCAIDPRPAILEDSNTVGMFKLFAELIAYHLDGIVKLEESNIALRELDKQLNETKDENRQYRFISNHNLQEPLRKLRVFSSAISKATEHNDLPKAKLFADKLNLNAQQFSMMINDLSEFSNLDQLEENSEQVDLNKVVKDVILQVDKELKFRNANVEVGNLPTINGIMLQMEQLFYHLITNALKFSKEGISPQIKISSIEVGTTSTTQLPQSTDPEKYVEIRISDNGIGIDPSQLEKIFDIFSKLDYDQEIRSGGIGLSYCRKIIRNLGGMITAESLEGIGTTFIIYIPGNRIAGQLS
jgi:signal transduction histidine kinase